MHIYFSGIGGTAIGPLALIARQAGYEVSGSDKQNSDYIAYLISQGVNTIHIGQERNQIAEIHKNKPIDWFVHSSAVTIENPNAPELIFCQENNIKTSKRDELINQIIADKNLKMVAVSGTHGKTTTTAMIIWLFKQLDIPVSYSVGAKISYGEMGVFEPESEYFVYEADEFDRNFLQFKPFISIIPGIAYDHPDIYPTQESYNQAFRDFISQSENVIAHPKDLSKIGVEGSPIDDFIGDITLPGLVNRQNAQLVVDSLHRLTGSPIELLIEHINKFPGVSRRFEKISENIYTDYAHTPEKIQGALQLAHEVAGNSVVVVYEGLHNTRQHFIKEQLKNLFAGTHKLYIVPSYLAREDESLELLTPDKLCELITAPEERIPSDLDYKLAKALEADVENGKLVLCLTAGGGGSLDEWLRKKF